MKSGTAAYWLPVTVNSIGQSCQQYEGYSGTKHQVIDDWLEEGLEYFQDIYGTVVDAHYVVETVKENENGNYDFHLSIVVTAIVNSDGEFGEASSQEWPSDLIEQLKEATERVNMVGVVSYDLNPIKPHPSWEKVNI